MHFVVYIGDVQAYTHCHPDHALTVVQQMCHAMDKLASWLASNRLLLNASKTQFIWLGGRKRLANVDRCAVAKAFPCVTFFDSVRDLGVILDEELSFSKHVNQLTRGCYYQIRQLRVISRSLSEDSAATLVHAFVTSRLDYCCSILVGLPQLLISRLDRVLRSAARLIGRIPKYASVSSYMRDTLHWLPISQRIEYRIASLVWRCLLGCAPTYLVELCRPVSVVLARRALRSASSGKLLVPRVETSTCQRRAFSVVGPSVWNSLPLQVRLLPRVDSSVFYKLLKTFCFTVVGLGALLSGFLEEALYKFLN